MSRAALGRAGQAPPVGGPADELARAVSARIAAVSDGGRLGVVFSGDPSSELLLGLAVGAVGRSNVVALVDTRAGATATRRCDVVQAANGLGAPVFDLVGHALDDAVQALDLSVVVVAADARRPDGLALIVPLVVTGVDPALVDLDGRAPDRPRESEDAVQVEAAESELRRLGLEDLRVRHHGELARIEAPHADLVSVTAEPLRGEVLRAVRSAGFRLVALDLGTLADPREA